MPSRATIAGAVLLLAATLLAYLPAVTSGYIWDDNDHVTDNRLLNSAAGLKAIWTDPSATPQYYPLVHTSFWLEYRLWGLRPLGYHLTNVLLHVLNALLVYGILRRLAVPGAWLAAAIFALHPVHVESVAWISERKNVLSGACYLAALLSYLSFAGIPGGGGGGAEQDRPRWGRYLLSAALFACALLSKTVTATLPAVLLLVLWWKKRGLGPRTLATLAPLLVLGGAAGMTTAWLERTHVGALGSEWDLSFVERALIAGRVPWFYLGKILWPENLVFIYPRWEISAGAPAQYLFPAALLAALTALWLFRETVGRAALAAVAFFLVTIFPAMGFFNVYPMRYSFVADHFQYLASLGPIALLAALLARGKGDDPPAPAIPGAPGLRARTPRLVAAAVLLAALGALTWRQAHAYKDEETLWRHTLAGNPKAWIATVNLGNILYGRGEYAAALDRYTETVRLNPKYAVGFFNWGNALVRLGRPEESLARYLRAIDLDPVYADAHSNLAVALSSLGRYDQALLHFESSRALKPANANTYYNLGSVYERLGRKDDALDAYRGALRVKPDFEAARRALESLAGR